MADQKISQLTQTSSVAGADEVPVLQSGANKRTPFSQVLTYIQAAISIAQSQVSGLVAALAAKADASALSAHTSATTSVHGIADTANLALLASQALTDGASISWNVANGAFATVTLGGNRTLANPTNLKTGASYAVKVTQDGTGGRTLSYGSAYKWIGGAPSIDPAANAITLLTFLSDGTNLYGVAQKGWA